MCASGSSLTIQQHNTYSKIQFGSLDKQKLIFPIERAMSDCIHISVTFCVIRPRLKSRRQSGQRGNTKRGKTNNIGHIGEGKWASDTEAQKVQKVIRVHRLRSTFKSFSLCPLNWSPMVSIASAQLLSFRYPKTSVATVQKNIKMKKIKRKSNFSVRKQYNRTKLCRNLAGS